MVMLLRSQRTRRRKVVKRRRSNQSPRLLQRSNYIQNRILQQKQNITPFLSHQHFNSPFFSRVKLVSLSPRISPSLPFSSSVASSPKTPPRLPKTRLFFSYRVLDPYCIDLISNSHSTTKSNHLIYPPLFSLLLSIVPLFYPFFSCGSLYCRFIQRKKFEDDFFFLFHVRSRSGCLKRALSRRRFETLVYHAATRSIG